MHYDIELIKPDHRYSHSQFSYRPDRRFWCELKGYLIIAEGKDPAVSGSFG